MANIFDGLQVGCSWKVTDVQPLTEGEKSVFYYAEVVNGQFGLMLEFHMKDGDLPKIPISTEVKCLEGFIPTKDSIIILTLSKEGMNNIYRVEF